MLCHDPRISDDRDQKVETENPSLVAAEMYRGDEGDTKIRWDVVAAMAEYADLPVGDKQDLEQLRQNYLALKRDNSKRPCE